MVAGPVVLVPLNATAASCSLNVSVNVGSALNNIVTATYTGGVSSLDSLQYQYAPSNITINFTIAGMPTELHVSHG